MREFIDRELRGRYPGSTPEFYKLYTNLIIAMMGVIEFYDFIISFDGDRHYPDCVTVKFRCDDYS